MDQFYKENQAYALKPGEGWVYRFGIDMTVKASEIKPGSGVAVLEYSSQHGEEPEDHSHPTEDEMFYVLDGSLTFRVGDQSFELEQGGFIFLPHGIQHGYAIRPGNTVRLLAITAPARQALSGGWGGFISDIELGQGELVSTPSR